MYKTVQITRFTRAFYVTAFGLVGCILFVSKTEIDSFHSFPIDVIRRNQGQSVFFKCLQNGLVTSCYDML